MRETVSRSFGLVTSELELATQVERVSHLFTWLLLSNYALGVVIAVFVASRPDLNHNFLHEHIWKTSLTRFTLVLPALLLSRYAPKAVLTRHAIAFTAILQSFWVIVATGGRIEGHFSVFIILATLSFYLDWTIFVTATVVGTAYHCVVGMMDPMLVYGVPQATPWRCVEHGMWIVYEVAILVVWITVRLGAIDTIVGLRRQLATQAEKVVAAFDEAKSLKDVKAEAEANGEVELDRIHRELALAEERSARHQKALAALLKRLLGETVNG